MKPSVLTTILSLCFISALTGQEFYDVSNINQIDIYFEETEWDSIMNRYYRDRTGERLKATIYINWQIIDSVGVRYKGFSSYKGEKKPLNIELNYLNSQRYNGIKTIKLSNGYRDPSFIREVLSYEIARKYMPASHSNYANVYINDEYKGVYISAEPVDDIFLKNHFVEENGVFIKGAPEVARGWPRFLGKADFVYLGSDSTEYFKSYDLKSERGWNDLIQLCEIIADSSSDISNVLNIDGALWVLSFHNLLVSLDSPINVPRNFYIYKDKTGLFNLIPWDFNMTFGTYKTISGSTGLSNLEQLQNLNPFLNINNSKVPLVGRLLKNPEYRKMYIAHMYTILKENFTNGWYIERGREIQEIISLDVMADANKFYTYDEFWDNLENTIGSGGMFIAGIEELMSERINFLESLPEFTAVSPLINILNNPESVLPNTDINIKVNVVNAGKVYLAYRNRITQNFNRIEMYDDGNHNDLQNDDNIYGVSINAGSGEIQYYFYAENENTAKFSPERAEYEYYTIPVAGDLVINEFMASNNTTVSDNYGEYDDWIELYNNSDVPLTINGYFLSDKEYNLLKWEIPDTVLESKQYLIIWADEDGSQGKIHANFKLSSEGESLFLLNPYQEVVDQITFKQQPSDLSFGRFPDGLGSFIQMSSTFNAENIGFIEEEFDMSGMPSSFGLLPNFPNPFNNTTNIRFYLKSQLKISLNIFDITGRRIRNLISGVLESDLYIISWNGMNDNGVAVSSGIYFCQMNSGKKSTTIKILLVK
jgi:spore coat protein CotH